MCIISIYSYKNKDILRNKVKEIVENYNNKISIIRLYYLNPDKYKIIEILERNKLLKVEYRIEIYNDCGEYIYKEINFKREKKRLKYSLSKDILTYKKNKIGEEFISNLLKEINIEYKYEIQYITYYILSFLCSLNLNNDKLRTEQVIIDYSTELNSVLNNFSKGLKKELSKININLI